MLGRLNYSKNIKLSEKTYLESSNSKGKNNNNSSKEKDYILNKRNNMKNLLASNKNSDNGIKSIKVSQIKHKNNLLISSRDSKDKENSYKNKLQKNSLYSVNKIILILYLLE